jgi:hypothetical protein
MERGSGAAGNLGPLRFGGRPRGVLPLSRFFDGAQSGVETIEQETRALPRGSNREPRIPTSAGHDPQLVTDDEESALRLAPQSHQPVPGLPRLRLSTRRKGTES